MTFKSTLLALALTLPLAACFETPEEQLARETQFNGMSVEQVEARIGPATSKTAQAAVWSYRDSYKQQNAIHGLVNGKPGVVGYTYQRVEITCDYTATLRSGKVVSSVYEGNSCGRFAPRLPK